MDLRSVILVDDDPITHTIVKELLPPNLSLISFFTYKEAVEFLDGSKVPALIIIDRMLPDGDGLGICTEIRRRSELKEIPIIFLSAKISEADKVGGFFAGADDYVTKPIPLLELKARIAARLKNYKKTITSGNLSINLETHEVTIFEKDTRHPVALTRIEFHLLVQLAKQPERILTREQLISLIWGETAVTDRVVDTHLSHLRKKIKGSTVKIEALRSEGYRLLVETKKAS